MVVPFASGKLKPKPFRSADFTCPWDPHQHSFQVLVDQDDSSEESDHIRVTASLGARSRQTYIDEVKFQLHDMKNDTTDEAVVKDEYADYDPSFVKVRLKLNAECDKALLSVQMKYKIEDRVEALLEIESSDEFEATLLAKALSKLFDDKQLSDVTLVVGDQELACHKAILATRSTYFRSLLSGNFRERGIERVAIDAPFDLLKIMVNFIYDGHIWEQDWKPVCLDLLSMADKYRIEDLFAACELLACSEDVVTSANVLDAMLVAHLCNCDNLLRFCVPIFTASKAALTRTEKWLEVKEQNGFMERLEEADQSIFIPEIFPLENNAFLKLANDIQHLFEDEVVPFDATLKVDDGSIRVHQAVLSARCRAYRERLECDGTEVVLPGRVEIVKEYVRFLYSVRLPEAEQINSLALEMSLLATQYGDDDHIELFARFWHFAISRDNVVDVFLRAVKYKCAHLIRFCRPIIIANRSCLGPTAWSRLEENPQAPMRLLQMDREDLTVDQV